MPILPDPEVIVLDPSAVLAYLGDEPGAEVVERVLAAARDGRVDVVCPALCLAEAMVVAVPNLAPERVEDFRSAIEQLPVRATPLDLNGAFAVSLARLSWGLGLPQAAAAVAAQGKGAMLLSADPHFEAFARAGGRVHWIGEQARRNELVLFDPLSGLM